jgi:hypothetical protein
LRAAHAPTLILRKVPILLFKMGTFLKINLEKGIAQCDVDQRPKATKQLVKVTSWLRCGHGRAHGLYLQGWGN